MTARARGNHPVETHLRRCRPLLQPMPVGQRSARPPQGQAALPRPRAGETDAPARFRNTHKVDRLEFGCKRWNPKCLILTSSTDHSFPRAVVTASRAPPRIVRPINSRRLLERSRTVVVKGAATRIHRCCHQCSCVHSFVLKVKKTHERIEWDGRLPVKTGETPVPLFSQPA